ncbi:MULTISPECIES: flagellar hook-associated protein FlgL [unclassified Clostridium]|uniref:flagellar hook-associated protein FlgL n=1 Tax=unclassified Clostridium TaxID=2614128 RepID=UPI0002975BBB|nr:MULTISPECIES: flagellar hook-associated protein FlgL [unclassified Clostridium]EKQ51144.1 MAG: flagellar hook-associated protein 3 [Clostridium sp. Maddingley MBC34-26]
MRITNSMLATNYLNNMRRNLNNMSHVQNQLASGKEIQRGSDNPHVAVRSMQLNSEIDANNQFDTNIQSTTNWLDTTDTALGEANNIMKRINTLMVKAGDGAYSPDEISAINDEVKEKVNELTSVLNTSFDGNFIFGGTKSTSKPVTQDASGKICYADKDGNPVSYNYTFTANISSLSISAGDVKNIDSKTGVDTLIAQLKTVPTTPAADYTAAQNAINDLQKQPIAIRQIDTSLQTEISDGIVVDYNKTATDILEFTNKSGVSVNVSDKLADIVNCLNVASGSATSPITLSDGTTIAATDSQTALSQINGNLLGYCTDISLNISKLRSNVGAMQNRMESSQKINEDQTYNMTSILSSTEDIDFTEKTMEYSVMQTVYTASLQTSAKVLTNTILDYLR